MDEVSLSAGQVAGGQVPPVCARHGQPAVMTRKLRLISKPPTWAAFLIILGALPYLIAVLATRKTVNAPQWPFCDRCKSERTRTLGIGVGVVGLGFLLFVIGIATTDSDSAVGPLLLLAGFLGLMVGLIVAVRSGWVVQSRAMVSRDGNAVTVRKPAEAFVQQAFGAPGQQPQQQYYQQY
jgi:hypothetical protein